MNPLIRRGIRERLRPKNLVASGLFSIIACATLYLASFFDGMQEIIPASESESGLAELISMPVNGAREAFTVLLVLQGFFLMFLGTGRVASVTAEEKEAGLLDYQRMTPMNPFSKILGYLFGLPAREYFMFLLTLPFLLHCMVVGKIPLLNLLQLYAVFFCSVILYHLTAHVIGLVVPKPRAASWVARLAVLGLYVFLPVLGQAGISFLSFLTILPTYFGKIVPHLLAEGTNILGPFERQVVAFWQEIPFFTYQVSPTTFTFVMQGLILLALFATAYRKWRLDSLPAFSKPMGIGLFGILQILLLGSLWPFFSQGEASGLLGQSLQLDPTKVGLPDQLKNDSLPSISMIVVQSTFFLLNLASLLLLINVCCPDPHRQLKGRQRSGRLGMNRVPVLADEAPGGLFVGALVCISTVVYAVLHLLAVSSETVQSVAPSAQSVLLPGLVLLFTALALRAAREQWFNLGFWGFVGLLWLTPMLACLVLAVADFLGNSQLMLNIASLSPPHILSPANGFSRSQYISRPKSIDQSFHIHQDWSHYQRTTCHLSFHHSFSYIKEIMFSSIHNLRILGNIEGVSYLILLGIAMPLKYWWGIPLTVKVVGMAHGILFVAYCLLLATCMKKHAWSFLFGLYLFVATLIPFGTFITDRKLKEFSRN